MLPTLVRRAMAAEVRKVPIPRRGVDYRGKVVLAPMVRSGETASRLLALHYGADLVWGPETVDRAMIGTTRRYNEESKTIDWCRYPSQPTQNQKGEPKESTLYRIHPEKEAGKLIFQMGTSDPERAVEAARLVAADVAGIDVNAGCPKPFSTSGGMGAALLRTPDKLCAILEALVQNIAPEFEIGISVKIRLLETPSETEALVRRLCATGITGLTIHCRTTPMRPRERAIRGQLKMIAEVCHEAGVACLMNGDVESKDQGLKLAEEFGADGAMIATAAEKNPSCFRNDADGGALPWQPVVEEYIKTTLSITNRWANTKFLLAQMVPGKHDMYKRIIKCSNYTDACNALGLDSFLDEARDADHRLGLDQPKQSKKAKSNAVAQAAGGKMAEGRAAQNQNRKPLSNRNVSAEKPVEREPVALAG